MSDILTGLYNQKLIKLEEQKVLSDQMNDILTRHGGMNDSSRMCRKNLQAAIAVSKQPGYFEYYTPPKEIKDIEDSKLLNSLVRSLGKVHREIEQINSDIATHKTQKNPEANFQELGLKTLGQWFEVYGTPKNVELLDELKTTFQASPKIYGGTNHHRAFKSQSSNMRKGRLTR
jgi:hypothetical protein